MSIFIIERYNKPIYYINEFNDIKFKFYVIINKTHQKHDVFFVNVDSFNKLFLILEYKSSTFNSETYKVRSTINLNNIPLGNSDIIYFDNTEYFMSAHMYETLYTISNCLWNKLPSNKDIIKNLFLFMF